MNKYGCCQPQQHIHQMYNRNSFSVSFNLYNIRLCFYIVQYTCTHTYIFTSSSSLVYSTNEMPASNIFYTHFLNFSLPLSFSLGGEKYCDYSRNHLPDNFCFKASTFDRRTCHVDQTIMYSKRVSFLPFDISQCAKN